MAKKEERGVSRSGRFTLATVAADRNVILIFGGDTPVRIYNSGETAFIVKPKGTGTLPADQITLGKKSSVDVRLANNDLVITQSAGPEIDGIYEYIEPFRTIRSGRFKGSAGGSAVIGQKRANEFYRILNSGKKPFDVLIDSQNRGSVRPRHSLDVCGISTRIVISSADNFQGIYDWLERRTETRSGRFKIKKTLNPDGSIGIDPMSAYTIINHTDAEHSSWYRLFNAGEHLIRINKGGSDLLDLQPDQSCDFKVLSEIVTVRSAATEHPIEGSYDFLREA